MMFASLSRLKFSEGFAVVVRIGVLRALLVCVLRASLVGVPRRASLVGVLQASLLA